MIISWLLTRLPVFALVPVTAGECPAQDGGHSRRGPAHVLDSGTRAQVTAWARIYTAIIDQMFSRNLPATF